MGRSMAGTVNLALQGGGSHGAFTWGVLERLLEDGRVAFEAVSGTSAGAMNAVVMSHGFIDGGPAGAIAALERFWTRIGDMAAASPMRPPPFDPSGGNLDLSPAYVMSDIVSRLVSPYDNLLQRNPLKAVLADQVDFARLRAEAPWRLYVTATDVFTGKPRVFTTEEIDLKPVLASACLPFMHRAVRIDGVPYWDGGYGGNPALKPVVKTSRSADILLVQINPARRADVPTTAREILNRVNEITFNAALLAELSAIDRINDLIRANPGLTNPATGRPYRMVEVMCIEAAPHLKGLNASSKLNATPAFLQKLRARGRTAAEAWLRGGAGDVGACTGARLKSLL